jgi:hypothetical protein
MWRRVRSALGRVRRGKGQVPYRKPESSQCCYGWRAVESGIRPRQLGQRGEHITQRTAQVSLATPCWRCSGYVAQQRGCLRADGMTRLHRMKRDFYKGCVWSISRWFLQAKVTCGPLQTYGLISLFTSTSHNFNVHTGRGVERVLDTKVMTKSFRRRITAATQTSTQSRKIKSRFTRKVLVDVSSGLLL